MKAALWAGVALPLLRPEILLAAPDDDYIRRYVHPELRAMAQQVAAYTAGTAFSAATLQKSRATMSSFRRPRLSDVPVEKREITRGPGQPPLTIYVVNARPGESRPAILHTHGGGFVVGSADDTVADIQEICKELGCAAVSVDYRLAPETSYAGSIEDNYAGLKWLHTNAASLGVDPARIAVMGESAGGGHAALLSITARDRGEVPVCFQCLLYPMLDDRTGTTRAVPSHIGKLVWTPESNRFGWQSFLAMTPGGPEAPKGAVPARVTNLANLPPAWIGVGSIDLFMDEDVDFAQRLNDAGVPAELIVVPGAFHGFDKALAPVSKWFNTAKLDALRRGLGVGMPESEEKG